MGLGRNHAANVVFYGLHGDRSKTYSEVYVSATVIKRTFFCDKYMLCMYIGFSNRIYIWLKQCGMCGCQPSACRTPLPQWLLAFSRTWEGRLYGWSLFMQQKVCVCVTAYICFFDVAFTIMWRPNSFIYNFSWGMRESIAPLIWPRGLPRPRVHHHVQALKLPTTRWD